MHRPRERPASKERHLPLTIPEVTAHLHRVKNIIVKMHLQKATSRNGDRNPGPGSAFANRWPRPGRKLPTRGESLPKGFRDTPYSPTRADPDMAVIDLVWGSHRCKHGYTGRTAG